MSDVTDEMIEAGAKALCDAPGVWELLGDEGQRRQRETAAKVHTAMHEASPVQEGDLVEQIARALWKETGPSNTGWTFEQDRADMIDLAQAAYAIVQERMERMESLLWRAMDDASIEPGDWYREARELLASPIKDEVR